jgi:hypothetical protein
LTAFFEVPGEGAQTTSFAKMGVSHVGDTSLEEFQQWSKRKEDDLPNVCMFDFLSDHEILLARMLGFFGNVATGVDLNQFPEILRDLDFVVEINSDDKPRLKMVSLKKEKANAETLHYCYFMILLKMFLADNFSHIEQNDHEDKKARFRSIVRQVLDNIFLGSRDIVDAQVAEANVANQAPDAGANLAAPDLVANVAPQLPDPVQDMFAVIMGENSVP